MSKGKNRLERRERSQLLREEQKVQHDKTVADRSDGSSRAKVSQTRDRIEKNKGGKNVNRRNVRSR